MARWRHELHRHPELSNDEHETQKTIVRALESIGVRTIRYPGFTGVLGVIGEDRAGLGPCVALRADMDGLPVTEETGLAFRSEVPGRMHACGHDVHMASLLGAAAILERQRNRLPGPVKLIFQPAEEEGERGGALPFLERGCLEDPHVDYVFGQHVEPSLPLGSVGYRSGALMAAADAFFVRVRGTAGHAAYPHRGPDAVLSAAEIVCGLQPIVSRLRDPVDPVVVSVGSIHGGTRHNVLPGEVRLEGTVRTFKPATRTLVERALRSRLRHLARAAGTRVTIDYRPGYPALWTDPAATDAVASALARLLGRDRAIALAEPFMGAEDFSRYLEQRPGTFVFLGVGGPTRTASLHSGTFAPPDEALVYGAATLLAGAEGLQRLAR